MNKQVLLLFFSAVAFYSSAQPFIQWQKSLGGSNGEEAYSIQQTSDSGYIVAGHSTSIDRDVTGNHGGPLIGDYWIVKLSSAGSIQWQKCLGGSDEDVATSIQQTADGGYIVAGNSYSIDGDVTDNHGGFDYWIVKLSSTGSIQWQKSLGGSKQDRATSIQQTADSGYIVAGWVNSTDGDVTGSHGNWDYWIVKLSSAGGIQWQKSLGGSNGEQAYSIQQTSDNGYIVAGYSTSTDGDVTGNHGGNFFGDYWIVKLNNSGNIQWQKCLGGSGEDAANSIQQTTDSGYIVAGFSASTDGDVTGIHGVSPYSDYWIVKLSYEGTIQWQKCFGGSVYDEAYSIRQTIDNGYIVAGMSGSIDGDVIGNHGPGDYWIIKLSNAGIIQWQKCLGGSYNDRALSIQQSTDGGYIVAGGSASFDGDVTGNRGSWDYWVVKLSALTETHDITSNKNLLTVYPNPLTSSSILQLNTQLKDAEVIIYDMLGKEMVRKKLTGDRMEIERGSLESGVYFVKVRSGERQWVEKVVVE